MKWLRSISQDISSAGRGRSRRQGSAPTAVAMLGLAIGLTTAMFTVVDALILRPAPFDDPNELAQLYMGNENGGRLDVKPAVLDAWRNSPAFAGAESARAQLALIDVNGDVDTRGLALVTPGLFELLGGVRPIYGRLFDAAEVRAGRSDQVILSEQVWRTLYHADPALLGKRVAINGEPLVVIGILPAGFRFPSWDTVIWRAVDVGAPGSSPTTDRPIAYVRFAPGLPRADALRMATAAARSADSDAVALSARERSLAGLMLDPYQQRAMPVLMGGVVLVFFVLCANVSGLLLTGLTTRQQELAVRLALGASRARLIRLAAVESGTLGLLGLVAGVGIAWALVALVRAFLPDAFLMRTLNPLDIDVRALAVAAASSLAATMAAGLLPAVIGTRTNSDASVLMSGRAASETRGSRALTRALLVGEMALACALLVGATQLVVAFVNLSKADRGIDVSETLVASVSLPAASFPTPAARYAVARTIEEQVAQVAGVRRVAWSYGVPPDGSAISFGKWRSDRAGSTDVDMVVDRYRVGPEFFSLYDIPVLSGRSFEPLDPDGSVVVGERLARILWAGQDPVGRTFSFQDQQFHVVGLVREIHHPSLDARLDRPEFYETFAGVGGYTTMSIRCGAACPSASLVRQRIVAVHPGVRVDDLEPLEYRYLEQLARPRAAAALGAAFAVIAVLAAAGGLFSVLSFAVRQRMRELGIRTAVGASPAQIRQLVIRDAVAVAAVGIAIGSAAAFSMDRALAALQYGVTIGDGLTWTMVLPSLTITTMLASWRPARVAMKVDCARLLRQE